MSENTITVAYADDHSAVRRGIISLLESDSSVKVTIQAKNGKDLLENLLLAEKLPDVCLLDINMPVMDGFVLLREIKRNWPSMPCIVFTVFDVESYIIKMIKNGANGYLLKNCDPDTLLKAIHSVYNNGYYYSETATNKTFNVVQHKKFAPMLLTDREVELLKYVCQEISYADIAVLMNTTYKAVDHLRERLGQKLNVTTRTGLILASVQLGFFTIESSTFSTK